MKDSEVTLGGIRNSVKDFISERNWDSKQNPKNVATSVIVEAAELLELFQWTSLDEAEERLKNPEFKKKVSMEIADIMFYLADMANQCNIELGNSFYEKLEQLEEKYPVGMGLNSKRYHQIKDKYRNRKDK